MFQRAVPKGCLHWKRLLVVPMVHLEAIAVRLDSLAALAAKGTEGIEEDKALAFEDSSASPEDTEDMAVDIVEDTEGIVEGIECKNCLMDSTSRTDIVSCSNCWSLGN